MKVVWSVESCCFLCVARSQPYGVRITQQSALVTAEMYESGEGRGIYYHQFRVDQLIHSVRFNVTCM